MQSAAQIVEAKVAEVHSTQKLQQLELLLARAIEAENFDECDKLAQQMRTVRVRDQWKRASSTAMLEDSLLDRHLDTVATQELRVHTAVTPASEQLSALTAPPSISAPTTAATTQLPASSLDAKQSAAKQKMELRRRARQRERQLISAATMIQAAYRGSALRQRLGAAQLDQQRRNPFAAPAEGGGFNCETEVDYKLWTAASTGDQAGAMAALAGGANPENVRQDRTVLAIAANNGHHELVRLIIQAGANVDSPVCTPLTRKRTGETPLHLASKHGHLQVARELLCLGANPNIPLPSTGFTALHVAASAGHSELCRLLACMGADLGLCATSNNGDAENESDVTMHTRVLTAAALAAEAGYTKTLAVLKEAQSWSPTELTAVQNSMIKEQAAHPNDPSLMKKNSPAIISGDAATSGEVSQILDANMAVRSCADRLVGIDSTQQAAAAKIQALLRGRMARQAIDQHVSPLSRRWLREARLRRAAESAPAGMGLRAFYDATQYLKRNDWQKALLYFQMSLDDGHQIARSHNGAGLCYANMGALQSAVDAFTRAVEADPEDARAWHNRAEALRSLQKFDAAVADSNRALDLDPEQALTHVIAASAQQEKSAQKIQAVFRGNAERQILQTEAGVQGIHDRRRAQAELALEEQSYQEYKRKLEREMQSIDSEVNQSSSNASITEGHDEDEILVAEEIEVQKIDEVAAATAEAEQLARAADEARVKAKKEEETAKTAEEQAAAERAEAKQADAIAAKERENAIVAHRQAAEEEEEARVAAVRAEEEAKDVKIAQENLQAAEKRLAEAHKADIGEQVRAKEALQRARAVLSNEKAEAAAAAAVASKEHTEAIAAFSAAVVHDNDAKQAQNLAEQERREAQRATNLAVIERREAHQAIIDAQRVEAEAAAAAASAETLRQDKKVVESSAVESCAAAEDPEEDSSDKAMSAETTRLQQELHENKKALAAAEKRAVAAESEIAAMAREIENTKKKEMLPSTRDSNSGCHRHTNADQNTGPTEESLRQDSQLVASSLSPVQLIPTPPLTPPTFQSSTVSSSPRKPLWNHCPAQQGDRPITLLSTPSPWKGRSSPREQQVEQSKAVENASGQQLAEQHHRQRQKVGFTKHKTQSSPSNDSNMQKESDVQEYFYAATDTRPKKMRPPMSLRTGRRNGKQQEMSDGAGSKHHHEQNSTLSSSRGPVAAAVRRAQRRARTANTAKPWPAQGMSPRAKGRGRSKVDTRSSPASLLEQDVEMYARLSAGIAAPRAQSFKPQPPITVLRHQLRKMDLLREVAEQQFDADTAELLEVKISLTRQQMEDLKLRVRDQAETTARLSSPSTRQRPDTSRAARPRSTETVASTPTGAAASRNSKLHHVARPSPAVVAAQRRAKKQLDCSLVSKDAAPDTRRRVNSARSTKKLHTSDYVGRMGLQAPIMMQKIVTVGRPRYTPRREIASTSNDTSRGIAKHDTTPPRQSTPQYFSPEDSTDKWRTTSSSSYGIGYDNPKYRQDIRPSTDTPISSVVIPL